MSPTPEARAARAAASARTSLRRRLRLALVAAGTVLALIVLTAVSALLQVQTRQREISQIYFPAISEADTVFTELVDAETAVRGYALTGDPVTLEPMERLLARPQPSRTTVQILADHLGSGARVVRASDDASAAAATWYQDFAQPTIDQVAKDGRGSVTPAQIEQGRVLFDDIRAKVAAYTALLREGRLHALAQLDTSMTLLRLALGALAVAPVVVGTLLWIFLRRWVTEPLAVLAADARAVAGGDLDHHVVDAGPGEVGDVARDVEQMRDRLARLLADSTGARAELERSHERLREQAEDLSRSNRDLEQFAYVASHDLQEPLRKVASFTQLLARRYEGQLDERADQYIAFAVDGAKRMQRLINDLLGFSRVGRIGGELADVDLNDSLAQATDDLQQVIEDTGATVTAVGLPHVDGEAPLLAQLMVNLVGNALKFRHPDRAPEIRVEARRAGDYWELACRDNGIGIDPQYADRVFVIFQRLHAKEVYEGTGIGLALCKKIVEFHGGQIWIDGGPGEGTVVRWTLPARAADPAAGERLLTRAQADSAEAGHAVTSDHVAADPGGGKDDADA
ncbi:MAG TPA: ATP-binding protein [Actinotalea sp.]